MRNTIEIENSPALDVLKSAPHWVCYRTDKVPFNPNTKEPAKANDPETWGTYEQAVKTWKASAKWYAGIGRELTAQERIILVDLDDCIDKDGVISDYAQRIIRRLNSYTEISRSKKGIHILLYGDNLPSNIGADPSGKEKIEIYFHLRYCIWTGSWLEGTPTNIEERNEEIFALYSEVRTARSASDVTKKREVRSKRKSSKNTGNTYGTPYGLRSLEDECTELAMAVSGGRNNQLNDSAFSLGQLIGGGELSDRDYVEQKISAAATSTGLEKKEIQKTMRGAIEAGIEKPRSAPISSLVRYEPTSIAHNNSSNGHNGNGNGNPKLTKEELCEFSEDDAGNGDALYALQGQDYLFCLARGWFKYTGTHWKLDDAQAEVRKSAVAALRQRRHAAVDVGKESLIRCTKADEGRVGGCVSRFKTLVNVDIEDFDNDPDMLNCKNGVVNLRTGVIKPHDRSQRFTYCVPIEYKQSHSTEWIDYLTGSVGGGQEVIDYLQMALGYSLTGHTSEEILFYVFGPSRSGKGTLSEVFMQLLPKPIAVMVDFNSFTAKREGDMSNFDLAPLKPSRMIFASESNRSQSLNPAKIKQLTGGDHITACFKHKDHFSYRPQFKVWMLSNHPVNGDPEDDALWGRVRVISFPNSYLGQEDKSKKARLKDPKVLESVLYWAVQGAMNWYKLGPSGLATPDAIAQVTQAHRSELDYVQQWLDESSYDDEDSWHSNETVISSYLEWCKNNNVQYPKGSKALAQSLKSKGYGVSVAKWTGSTTKRGVTGIKFF